MSARVDPYAQAPARAGLRFLLGLNPLAKVAATAPAMIALIFVRDLATPAAFVLLAYALLLVGARLTWRTALLLAVGLPLAVAVIGFSFSLWTDASRVDQSVIALRVGGWTLYAEAVRIGFATALRLAAIVALSLVFGLTTTGTDLVRSMVQQLRIPYRVGYTALAAFRFVPRFRHELDIILRGAHGGRGPFAAIARGFGYVVPLLAGAIRHAERVALAMDARGFGAHSTRTERHLVPWRVRDTVFVLAFWAVSLALFVLGSPWSPS